MCLHSFDKMAQQMNGAWNLTYADNVGEYCDAIGCAPQYRDMALKLLTPGNNIIQEVSIGDEAVSITTKMPGKTTTANATLGATTESLYLDGRPIKSVFTLDGDKLKEEQTGPFQSTNLRFMEGTNMYLTMTAANGVTTTRKYEKA